MNVLLELGGKAILAQLFKQVTEFAMSKLANLSSFAGKTAKEEAEAFVKLNLKLPAKTPDEKKEAAIKEATMLVLPSFKEIMRFDPKVKEIERKSGYAQATPRPKGFKSSPVRVASKKASGRPFGAMKSVANKTVAKKGAAKKIAAEKIAAKPVSTRKTVVKKAVVKRMAAKKTAKKMAIK